MNHLSLSKVCFFVYKIMVWIAFWKDLDNSIEREIKEAGCAMLSLLIGGRECCIGLVFFLWRTTVKCPGGHQPDWALASSATSVALGHLEKKSWLATEGNEGHPLIFSPLYSAMRRYSDWEQIKLKKRNCLIRVIEYKQINAVHLVKRNLQSGALNQTTAWVTLTFNNTATGRSWWLNKAL